MATFNHILAFSSSRVGNGGYLENAGPVISDFLGITRLRVAFIPFASVDGNFEEYTSLVRAGLSGLRYIIDTVTKEDAASIISAADVIMTGGGNTFKLLHDIYESKILDLVRDKVNKGTPYIGWSAGSNILGPGIGTTNDMPIIMPKSFDALGLLPFQLNPHYYNQKPEGFNGETRDQRLSEFLKMNPGLAIVGLPEGTAVKTEKDSVQFIGDVPGVLFEYETDGALVSKRTLAPGEDLSFLM